MRSLRSQKHWDGFRSILEISIHALQIDEVLECVDADASHAAQGDEKEDDAGELPELYGVARYLMPAAMIEAVVREPHLTRLTR
jgi:hypothetical protein